MRSNNALAARFVRNAWYVVVPKEQIVVQALLVASLEVMPSCEQAACGTWMTRVFKGETDYRAAS